MPRKSTSERVPDTLQPRFDAIVAMTTAFSVEHLNAEYATLFRQMTATLCRKRPSPLVSGKAEVWAAAIVHAIGTTNFTFDRTQTPSVTSSSVPAFFGVSQGSMQAKSKLIRDMLKITLMDPQWTLPSRMGGNLMAWLVEVNGLILDVRTLPREIQEDAFRRGLIPYVPEPEGPTS